MRVFGSFNEAKGKVKNAVVTVGSFDGVHIGHKEIINRLNEQAKKINGESVLVTFYPHPREILYSEQNSPALINSQSEKIKLLESTGLNNLLIENFTKYFSKTSSHKFIVDYLIDKLDTRIVVIGHNYYFGYNRQGNFSYLYKLSQDLNFSVEDIPLKTFHDEIVSSTKIREALLNGNIELANSFLGHHFFISGIIKQYNELVCPDITKFSAVVVEEKNKLIPPPGIYAISILHKSKIVKGVAIIFCSEYQQNKIAINLLNNMILDDDALITLYFLKTIKVGRFLNNEKPGICKELLNAIESIR